MKFLLESQDHSMLTEIEDLFYILQDEGANAKISHNFGYVIVNKERKYTHRLFIFPHRKPETPGKAEFEDDPSCLEFLDRCKEICTKYNYRLDDTLGHLFSFAIVPDVRIDNILESKTDDMLSELKEIFFILEDDYPCDKIEIEDRTFGKRKPHYQLSIRPGSGAGDIKKHECFQEWIDRSTEICLKYGYSFKRWVKLRHIQYSNKFSDFLWIIEPLPVKRIIGPDLFSK